jgi:hypothetical protein
MPFTASLDEDRKHNGLAACAGLLSGGLWNNLPWEVRRRHCQVCLLRFTKQPSCSLDFLTMGNVGQLKGEIAKCLAWVSEIEPEWTSLGGCVHEVEFAYTRLGWEFQSPTVVLDDFMRVVAGSPQDEELWRDWNIYVEQYEGKPARADIPEQMKSAVEEIVASLTAPTRFSGENLLVLYAAAAVFEDAATQIHLPVLKQMFSHLLVASRTAVMANATLEVS